MSDLERRRLLDFPALAGRLQTAAGVLAVVAVVGAIVEALIDGLNFGLLLRWATLYVVALLFAAAVVVALHAYRGAETAQERGERLSGRDVGLAPPRRSRQ
jgi:hypothetical protein